MAMYKVRNALNHIIGRNIPFHGIKQKWKCNSRDKIKTMYTIKIFDVFRVDNADYKWTRWSHFSKNRMFKQTQTIVYQNCYCFNLTAKNSKFSSFHKMSLVLI